MKKHLLTSCGLAMAAMSFGQAKGPSSSETAYMTGVATGVQTKSILTVGDKVGGYTMCGIPDGLGAFDNGDGTFTLVMNHEFGGSGFTRAHGENGAFVSKWVIKKDDLTVLSGTDLMQRVNLWNGTGYTLHYASNPSSKTEFSRFCSADLPEISAFYDAKTGKGTMARIFMNGEESGSNGRGMGHIITGAEAGTSYELPYLGKMSWENSIANPGTGEKTVVVGTDDATGGQIFVYIGEKQSTGNEIEKAGLHGGKLYAVAVNGLLQESNSSIPSANTAFALVDLGIVANNTGSEIETKADNAGATGFLRPEDGAWDPRNPQDFYFVTTNGFNENSRLWKLHFNSINDLTIGGTITAVCDGSEGQHMFDNITIDHFGHIIITEDPGGNAHNALMWQYDIATDSLKVIAKHDPARFEIGGADFLTTNEEASGQIDMQHILGPGWFILADQAHYGLGGELVEGGQLMAFYNPDTYNANPEIVVEGNNKEINAGDMAPTVTDHTDFDVTPTGSSITKTFTIKNTGVADLEISAINIGGTNAAQFKVVNTTFPIVVGSAGSKTVTIEFAPLAVGLNTATVTLENNDFDESDFTFAIQGVGLNPVDVKSTELNIGAKLYPNPTSGATTVALSLSKEQQVMISVVDIQGRVAMPSISQHFSAGEQQVTLNTENLVSGNYLVVITSDDKVAKMKLVVAH